MISLDKSSAGQEMKIHSIPSGPIRAQLIRIGLNEGVRVVCFERLPGGTVVIQKNRQQIAIGHNIARQILVVLIDLEAANR